MDFRVGLGNDLHRLSEGKSLILGGVLIPHTHGFEAHSDGDILLHALIDALLGALAMGDIGEYFPDHDPQYRGSDSQILLQSVYREVQAMSYEVVNLDAIIMLEKPKLLHYKKAIIKNLSSLLMIHENCISLKAKTNEGVDAIGKQTAAAAQVVVLLRKLSKGESR